MTQDVDKDVRGRYSASLAHGELHLDAKIPPDHRVGPERRLKERPRRPRGPDYGQVADTSLRVEFGVPWTQAYYSAPLTPWIVCNSNRQRGVSLIVRAATLGDLRCPPRVAR